MVVMVEQVCHVSVAYFDISTITPRLISDTKANWPTHFEARSGIRNPTD